jgi:erythronate-4-phosphate dehydrogenase
MKKIKIIADDKIPFLKGVLEPFAEVTYLDPLRITREIIKDVDALLVRTRTKCDSKLLNGSAVKFIGTATIGFDHIDTEFCETNGIKWINAPGCNSTSVQQYVLSALLKLAQLRNMQLDSMVIGVVGVGNVGSKVQKAAGVLGMKVLLNDPPRQREEGDDKFVSLDCLIEKSDILTFHVPLNMIGIDKTYHLADDKFFEKFNEDKTIINTSRGEVIDTNALKNTIKNKKVNSSVIDVWENEPKIDIDFMNLVDIATPHIAGYSIEGKANATAACVNALNKYFILGLEENWYPKNLPAPVRSKEIKIDCSGKSRQEIFFEVINSTYNIAEDDKRLRNDVSNFEQHRTDYPVRREFSFYNVRLLGADKSLHKALSELGFNFI